MVPPAQTITVALDMNKAFDTINIHTLISKLQQTKIPGTIIKFIANYIKGRKTYTTYRNYTSSQRQCKTDIPQGGVLSPTLFNIYTTDLPPSKAPVQIMVYALPGQNKAISDKTTGTLFTPDPATYKGNMQLKINNTVLHIATTYYYYYILFVSESCSKNETFM